MCPCWRLLDCGNENSLAARIPMPDRVYNFVRLFKARGYFISTMPNEPVTSPGPHVDIFRPSESPITDLDSLEKNITQSLLWKVFLSTGSCIVDLTRPQDYRWCKDSCLTANLKFRRESKETRSYFALKTGADRSRFLKIGFWIVNAGVLNK